MNLDIKKFYKEEFGNIRIIVYDNKILFCCNDVINSLSYKNQKYALIRFCRYVEKHDIPTESGVQSMDFITKDDVYRLIANSKFPRAQEFETWVFDEILPTIE